MNSYDFDDTIFRGNSFRRFFGYCLVRFPWLVVFLPVVAVAVVLRAVRILDKNTYLTWLGLFVALVPHTDKHVCNFWNKNMCRIKAWYLEQKRDDDVIVSASPDYLVAEACRRLGVACIATIVDHTNGCVDGVHCYGEQKVVRFVAAYPNVVPVAYYSDSWSDKPMFDFCGKGYLVKGDKVTIVDALHR